MRLAFVLRAFGGPGGTEKYAADLAGWLVGEGVSVDVWCVRADPEAVARTGVGERSLSVSGRGWAADRALLAAAREVPRAEYDLVQGFGRTVGHDLWRAGGGVHAAWLEADGEDAPLRRLRARFSPRERWNRRVDRDAARSARRVVCNSRMAARQVSRWHGVPEERVVVARNGVDGARFFPSPERREAARRAWAVPDGGRVALFLGTGFRRKGLRVAAEGFARVAGADDRLVVIGRDGASERRLRQVGRQLGDRLVGHGPVTDPECWIPGADATILPTRYDAAANSVLESLASGVPAVTTRRDGSAEVVPDPALVMHDPLDAEQAAAALERAWSAGPALAERCREVAAEWTVARNGMTMLRVYRELIDG